MEPFYQRLQENKGPPTHFGLILQKRCCESNSTCSSCTIVKGRHPSCFFVIKNSVKQNTAPVRYPSLCQTKNNLMYTPLNHEKLVASWQTSCVYFRLQILYIQGFGIPTPDLYITRYLLPATTSCSHPRWFAVLSMLKFTPWKFDSLNLQKNSISKFGISLANC